MCAQQSHGFPLHHFDECHSGQDRRRGGDCAGHTAGAGRQHQPSGLWAAARIAGADRIFKLGGAQAVAALAYGTESVPRVDKIVGPGGIYVATAKRKVFGRVAIDMVAGPSEILVLADGGCRPDFVAADLLSQAEHDVFSSAVLVTDSLPLAQAVQREVEVQLERLPRREIARRSVEENRKDSPHPQPGRGGGRRQPGSLRSTWSCAWRTPSLCCPESGTPAASS